MRAITIWQPWADLIVHGYKLNETRSWATAYTGPIAIHAAKFRKLPHEVYEDIAAAIGITPEGYRGSWLYYLEHGVPSDRFGAVVGTATLGKVLPTTIRAASPREKALGDFTAGRYAWPLLDVHCYERPVPAKGKQGLWTWEPPT
jgi:hypothetical protein